MTAEPYLFAYKYFYPAHYYARGTAFLQYRAPVLYADGVQAIDGLRTRAWTRLAMGPLMPCHCPQEPPQQKNLSFSNGAFLSWSHNDHCGRATEAQRGHYVL
jgi:hypothetical protein